jgi:hypothetical protein
VKSVKDRKLFFFVDESGDPYFYDRNGNYIVGNEGASKILLLGFIKTESPESIRKQLKAVKETLQGDPYLQSIPSFKKSMAAFHAKDDCPEVRERVFRAIFEMNFKSEFIVARKQESIFLARHRTNPDVFYDDLVTKLFQNQLHRSAENIIYFSVRSNRARQQPLENAIRTALLLFEEKWRTKVHTEIRVYPQRSEGEPCLQVADYMNWAVQRAFVRGETRFMRFVDKKISLIVDVYDFEKYPNNYYSKKNPFDIKKISPL